MAEYEEMLTSAISDEKEIESSDKKEVSADYKVLTKGDDGSTYYPIKESFMATYSNQEKSSLDPGVFESMEVFTKDGKEYLGVKKENLTSEIDPYVDKYKVTYYPEEGKHNVYTSGSELSEIYKNIDVPKDLISKWRGGESGIDTDEVMTEIDIELGADDASLFGV